MRATQILGESGPFAGGLDGYELREAQLSMAQMVEDTLEHKGIALVEAGTGTGKTLAYLVPALRSGKKVIVSTGTRTLQDQIMESDLPLLERHLGIPIRAACMKGLANYLCRRRYRELLYSPSSHEPQIARKIPLLIDWVARTESGDRAEISEMAEDDPIWAAVQSGSETRIGARCSHYDECFVTKMRERAQDAQLVVVNHHLFFADLATRGPHGGGILPEYDAVIFDEAHQVEDVATLFFGVQLGEQRIHKLVRDADRALLAQGLFDRDAVRVIRTLGDAAEAFFSALPAPKGPQASRSDLADDFFRGENAERYHTLDAALEALEMRCVRDAAESEAIAQLARRAERARDDLGKIGEGTGHENVTWCERRGDRRVIGASPVDVSSLFRSEILHRIPSVVLTSATLAVDGSFDFVKRRLGVDFEIDEAILASPFDYASQAALYLPALPDPRADDHHDSAFEEVRRLIELTGGGAFVLCTSVRAMTLYAERAKGAIASPILVQGQAPKGALLARFREDGSAVLFATMSFWEGVDVPGDALRLVIVDRLPFDVPSDPLTLARCRRIEEKGESPFMRYSVPAAALTLKQAFGRLVRTRKDRGIVAILDSRIRTKGYGQVFVRSLPDARRCDSFEEVAAFWSSVRARA